MILIGTSGYDYPEWKGVFYPPSLKREDFLPYYSEKFNAVELNYSYYTMPTADQLKKMVSRSGKRLKISIKANQQLTHHIELNNWRERAREFRAALHPVQEEGLLSAVLFQFPQSFHREDDNRRYLASLIDEFPEHPLIVEFRHSSWQVETVYRGMDERGVACCSCDMPEISRLPKFTPVFSGETAYMRFHGRNAKNWYGTNARDRYDYLYSDGELSAYAPVLRDVSKKSQTLQVFFNNHAKGSAAVNALKMMVLLEEEGA
jgi:uncharacterized protein YecE (DUF72 family)